MSGSMNLVQCRNCNEYGHFARDCPHPRRGNSRGSSRGSSRGGYRNQSPRFQSNTRARGRGGTGRTSNYGSPCGGHRNQSPGFQSRANFGGRGRVELPSIYGNPSVGFQNQLPSSQNGASFGRDGTGQLPNFESPSGDYLNQSPSIQSTTGLGGGGGGGFGQSNSESIPNTGGTCSYCRGSHQLNQCPDLHLPAGEELKAGTGIPPVELVDKRKVFKGKDIDKVLGSYAVRNGFADESEKRFVVTNHFAVTLEGKVLYQYKLTGDYGKKPSRARRREIMEWFINSSTTLSTKKDLFATDYIDKIISWEPLYPEKALESESSHETQRYTISVRNRDKPKKGSQESDHPDKKTPEFVNETKTFDICFEGGINVSELREHVDNPTKAMETFESVETALNIVISKCSELVPNAFQTFKIGGNKFYRKSGYEPLHTNDDNGLLVCHRGYFSSMKPAMGNVLLNVNNTMGVFYRPMRVSEFLGKARTYFKDIGVEKALLGVRVWIEYGPDDRTTPTNGQNSVDNKMKSTDAQNSVQGMEQLGSMAELQIFDSEKGKDPSGAPNLPPLAQKTEEPESKPRQVDPRQRVKTIKGIGQPLDKQTFKGENGQDVKVLDYLQNTYGNHFINGSFNCKDDCINLGSKEKPLWYAPHTLWILPYQPFKPKLTSNLQRDMIKLACRTPETNMNAIATEAIKCIGLDVGQNTLRNAGLQVALKMMEIPARVSPQPSLLLNRTHDQVEATGKWNLDGYQFHQTPSLQQIQAFYFFNLRGGLSVEGFHHEFNSKIIKCGLPSLKMAGKCKWPNHGSIENPFDIAKHKKAQLLIFLTSDQRFYDSFKQEAEQIHGFKTVCMLSRGWEPVFQLQPAKDARQEVQRKWKRAQDNWPGYAANVAMKINLKFNGINQKCGIGQLSAIQGKGLMILGADATHPSPGSAGGLPSIAALVGTVDDDFFLHYGSMAIQQPEEGKEAREVMEASTMNSMVKDRMDAYEKVNGNYPKQILYYRDGVSKSQYQRVKDKEIEAIKQAYEDRNLPPPKITAVIVTKRHHTRLFRGEYNRTVQAGANRNVFPGTAVESGITSPFWFDFFLCSHNGIQGTSKPGHYFILQNDIGFTPLELQDVTQRLCYMYVRATLPVSYAPAAYYADRLCERGRVYLRRFFDGSFQPSKKLDKEGILVDDDDATKQQVEQDWTRSGNPTGNPWHRDLNNIMFWM